MRITLIEVASIIVAAGIFFLIKMIIAANEKIDDLFDQEEPPLRGYDFDQD